MAEREQRRRPASRSDESDAEEIDAANTGEELKAELDDLLDEIDGVLESNAEEFVKNYVQKGGEGARFHFLAPVRTPEPISLLS